MGTFMRMAIKSLFASIPMLAWAGIAILGGVSGHWLDLWDKVSPVVGWLDWLMTRLIGQQWLSTVMHSPMTSLLLIAVGIALLLRAGQKAGLRERQRGEIAAGERRQALQLTVDLMQHFAWTERARLGRREVRDIERSLEEYRQQIDQAPGNFPLIGQAGDKGNAPVDGRHRQIENQMLRTALLLGLNEEVVAAPLYIPTLVGEPVSQPTTHRMTHFFTKEANQAYFDALETSHRVLSSKWEQLVSRVVQSKAPARSRLPE